MSAKFEATFYGAEIFEVEITNDLEITFPKYDLTFDRAAHEFGYPKTKAMFLAESWQADPMSFVELCLLIPSMMRMLVSCDWAEHVLPIFERRSPKRVRSKPRMIVEAIRRYLTDAVWNDTVVEYKKGARLRDDALKAKQSAVGYAAELAAQATLYVAHSASSLFIDTSPDVSNAAAAAFAWYDTDKNISPDIETRQAKKEEEYIWQVRRLIAVIEAVQAGKPRPPMGATP